MEKARVAAARVISQAGFSFRKGKGRPKNCDACGGVGCESCNFTGKMPGKGDVPISQGEAPGEAPGDGPPLPGEARARIPVAGAAAPDSAVNALFRRSCVASVKGLLGILKAIVTTYANAAGIKPDFTEKTLAKADPDPEALADFTEALDAVLKKRNIQPENAEEWALFINGARLVAPYGLLLAEFKGEIRRQRGAKP